MRLTSPLSRSNWRRNLGQKSTWRGGNYVRTNEARLKVKRLKILVLGSDTLSFLSVVRSLGRAGHELHVAWYVDNSAALASRYIGKRHVLAQYRANDPLWLSGFQELLSRNSIDIVVPCTDAVISPLQAVQDQLQTKAKLCVLPPELYRTASSKNAIYQIATELEIHVAKGVTVSCEEDVQEALSVLSGPWVFKPDVSYSGAAHGAKNLVQKAFTREQALHLFPGFLSRGKFQIQENFIGIGTGVEVLCERGEILLEFQHVRVHEPPHGGGSSYRRGVPVHPGMREATKKLMARLQYTGVAMVEFKWDQVNDRWIFIELNARFWGSLPLAIASGADFPRALVELLMSGRRPASCEVRPDLYARNVAADTDWLISNIRADKSNPALSALPLRVVLTEIFNIARGKERWDSLALDDPAPFFREISGVFKIKAQAVLRRIVCTDMFLAATRTWRRRRLCQRLRRAKNIGFVCYGNICRSPFAESYAQKNINGINFFSAGFHQSEKRPPPRDAVTAAQAFSIDLSAHRSRLLTPQLAQMADLLFVFDRKNLRDMRFSFSDVTAKTFLLSDLCVMENLEVVDPWDYGLEFFFETYRTIQTCVDALRNSQIFT